MQATIAEDEIATELYFCKTIWCSLVPKSPLAQARVLPTRVLEFCLQITCQRGCRLLPPHPQPLQLQAANEASQTSHITHHTSVTPAPLTSVSCTCAHRPTSPSANGFSNRACTHLSSKSQVALHHGYRDKRACGCSTCGTCACLPFCFQ